MLFRPSKIARLSPSVETDVVWRSIVKKPGLLTLKRLPEDGSELEPSKPKPGVELEPSKPKPGAELEPSKPKPGAKKKNLSNWKSCSDISVSFVVGKNKNLFFLRRLDFYSKSS